MKKYKAFTLAEIMIVLTVIGVLTAILLPAAFHATPDENIMKFKKANSTLGTAIRELVNSDKYYLEGDLGIKADGTLLNNTDENLNRRTYFCETFADMLSVKSKNCTTANTSHPGAVDLRYGDQFSNDFTDNAIVEITPELLQKSKEHIDLACKSFFGSGATLESEIATYPGSEVQIETTDGVFWWEVNPAGTFGHTPKNADIRRHSAPSQHPASYPDSNGFDTIYKIICFDVDGIPSAAAKDDCVNECPFGYGIRADGKILPGARADEWIQKSIQKED